ncbi:MAG TPA: DUF4189 domain-containing protein [Xanthobacteraceae bacterium]|nr:DUF4189 domain-containing protein [Xanthobacteraceae bacterium]
MAVFAGLLAASPAFSAGALAIGKCGSYGQAFDYASEGAAITAARNKCKGQCTVVPMKRACAALAIDMTDPCGAHGYSVAPKISGAQNKALLECYKYGGKECVIRAWACDARG